MRGMMSPPHVLSCGAVRHKETRPLGTDQLQIEVRNKIVTVVGWKWGNVIMSSFIILGR
jgi:hypothetical protein